MSPLIQVGKIPNPGTSGKFGAPTETPVDLVETLWLDPTVIHNVEMGAGVRADVVGTGEADSDVVVDPTFALDQGAFDQVYGQNSFPLSNAISVGILLIFKEFHMGFSSSEMSTLKTL